MKHIYVAKYNDPTAILRTKRGRSRLKGLNISYCSNVSVFLVFK